MKVTVEVVTGSSPHLEAIKALGRRHSGTLGFLPVGAFDEHAARQSLLGAINSDGQCIGYLLYRRTKDRVVIVHLCVASDWQGHGIAKQLVSELSRRESIYRGIGLTCRRDYEAHRVWPQLGFVAQREHAGRSHDGKPLTYWWRDHGHPTLFESACEPDRTLAVIDANVFFDLVSEEKSARAESKALLADWLSDSLVLCVTDELFNEINRNKTGPATRKKLIEEANRFARCPSCTWETVESRYEQLARQLKLQDSKKPSTHSDLRQLARAIGGGVPFFVTRDEELLDASDEIYRVHNITVIRPSELIIHLDELERESQYQPRRLSGTALRISRVQQGQDEFLASSLMDRSGRETKGAFLRKLRDLLATPDAVTCEVIADQDGNALALVACRVDSPHELNLELFRIAPGPLAPTISRHLLFRYLKQAVQRRCHALRITDPILNETTTRATGLDPFFRTDDGGWVRLSLQGTATAVELVGRLKELAGRQRLAPDVLRLFTSEIEPQRLVEDVSLASEFERAFWPAKVVDSSLPSFIVPIRPEWAQHLFDERLASQDLFGVRMELALNRESAYYRAARPGILSAPGRILWYVSQSKRFGGAGELTACSRLEQVVVDTPKPLFRQFRRLGVYEWRNVIQTAKDNLDEKIMALRFCDSEALARPVSRKKMMAILQDFGVRTQLQSPVRIPAEAFIRLYDASLA